MTPAKLLALQQERLKQLELEELPIAAFRAQYYNSNRDPGDAKANPPREAAQVRPLSDFQCFGNRQDLAAKTNAAPVPGGDHNLLGARANVEQWKAWARGKNPAKVVVRKG